MEPGRYWRQAIEACSGCGEWEAIEVLYAQSVGVWRVDVECRFCGFAVTSFGSPSAELLRQLTAAERKRWYELDEPGEHWHDLDEECYEHDDALCFFGHNPA